MSSRLHVPWLALALAAALACLRAADTTGAVVPEVRIGIMAPEGVSDVLHTWDFLVPTLERALPGYRIRLQMMDVASLRRVAWVGGVGTNISAPSGWRGRPGRAPR